MSEATKKITAVVAIMCLSACADYDAYKNALQEADSTYVVGIDGKLDSMRTGIAGVDSAIGKGFKAVASTINGLKEKVAQLEEKVEKLEKENATLKKALDSYRGNGGGKPFRLLPAEN